MSNIDLKALRKSAVSAISHGAALAQFDPARIVYLLDRLEAAEKEREELRKEVTVPASNEPGEQDWSGMSGAVAWHLIERHAGNWAEVGQMMEKWARAILTGEALRKDAERYAFVRMAATSEDDRYQDAMAREAERFDGQIPDAAMFDGLIDAVMAQEGGK